MFRNEDGGGGGGGGEGGGGRCKMLSNNSVHLDPQSVHVQFVIATELNF